MPIPKELEGYDWSSAFQYAGKDVDGEYSSVYGTPDVRVLPGMMTSRAEFTRANVVKVLGAVEGENDGPPWICAGQLDDGRWFYLEAGCDYTGWDCQAGGSATVCDTEEQLRKFCVTESEAARFGWTAP